MYAGGNGWGVFGDGDTYGGMRECGGIKRRRRGRPLKGFLSLTFFTLAIKEEAGAGRHSASGEITSGGIVSRVTATIFLQFYP